MEQKKKKKKKKKRELGEERELERVCGVETNGKEGV